MQKLFKMQMYVLMNAKFRDIKLRQLSDIC